MCGLKMRGFFCVGVYGGDIFDQSLVNPIDF